MESNNQPRVFYVKCKPQKADAIELVLKHNRVFVGYPPWIKGKQYNRHHVKDCIMDISASNEDWQLALIKPTYKSQITHNRNLALRVSLGDYVLVPRLDRGIVYIGRINKKFELVDDPHWFDEYLELRKQQKRRIEPPSSHLGDVVQSWSVTKFTEIIYPLIPRWLSYQLLRRNTVGWIKGVKAAQIVEQMYYYTWKSDLSSATDSSEFESKLLDWVNPNMFEHLVCSLLQLEFPEHYWFHTGGSGDCGVDGMALDKAGKICAFVQCKCKTNEDLDRIASKLKKIATPYWGENIKIIVATLNNTKVKDSKNVDNLGRKEIANLMIKHRGKYYGSHIFEGPN